MVREYILTPRERKLLKRFLETNEKLNGFSVLIHLLKKSLGKLEADLELIQKALEKASEKNRGKR